MFHACEDNAKNKAATDAPGARELARWSYIISTVGIVFGIVVWIYIYNSGFQTLLTTDPYSPQA